MANWRFNADANTGHAFCIFMASVGALWWQCERMFMAEAIHPSPSRPSPRPMLQPILPRRHPRPLFERAVEGAGFGEADAFGDFGEGPVGVEQVVDGGVAAGFVLELLEAAALIAQAAPQEPHRDAPVAQL